MGMNTFQLYDFFSDVIGTMLEQETDNQRVASPIRRALTTYNEACQSTPSFDW